MKNRSLLMLPMLIAFAWSCTPSASGIRSVRTEDGIEIREDGSRVLFYQMRPRSLDGKFERASYIHPLYTLKGNIITEDFPEDHPHHHGIYSAWHQILLNGEPIGDGWTGENISWEVVDAQVTGNGGSIAISSEVLWKYMVDDNHEPIVRETLRIIVHPVKEQIRMIDFDFDLFALKDSLEIGGSDDEKGYGGFSLRLKLPEDIRFISEGKSVEPQVVGVLAGPWMDFSGSFDGENQARSGIAVFSHPSNPGSPQPWILRKEKSMQNAAFPGRTPVLLKKEPLKFRYRMMIHNGEPDVERIGQLYGEYAKS